MFSFKFISVAERNNQLRLRILNNRRKSELSMGINVGEDELNKILLGSRGANPLHTSLIRQWLNQLEIIKTELLKQGRRDIDVGELKKIIDRELFNNITPEQVGQSQSIWENYFAKYAEGKKNRSYRQSCEYTLSKMRQLVPDLSDMSFDDVTLRWLNNFDEALIGDGASKNTRCIHFKNIRTCLNRAIDEELTSNYPFRRFKIRAEETPKRNLPVEELRRLLNYDIEPYAEFYRDMFALMFMLIGINTIDLYNAKCLTLDGRLEYRRAKTKKLYSIKVEPEALRIIEKYRGESNLLCIADRWADHRDFQKQCNIALKRIGRVKRIGRGGKKIIKPEWPELSTYCARHSWATIAYSLDIPKDIISQALGHSDGSAITEIYIQRDQKKVDQANRRVLNWVLYGKK